MRMTLAFGALLSLAGQSALAQPAPQVEDRAGGYCDYVRGVGDAEAALELAPELFAGFGAVNAGEAGGDGAVPLDKPRLRVTAGLGYDFVGLYRGRTLRQRAEAECRRQRALSALQAAVRQGTGLGEETALDARARILADALPRAEELVGAVRAELREGRSTLEELNAVQVRLDHLRALATETALARERLASQPRFPAGQRLDTLLEDLRAADDQVEAHAGSLRRARAWRLSLRGGYDEVLDVEQDLPLFGQLTLAYNLGHLWQGSANERAREGRRRAALEEVDGTPQRVAELVSGLRAVQRTEEARLREVSALVTDLEGQLREVEALQTREVRRFRAYLQLELTRLRAEQAYLSAHVESLNTFLGARTP